MIGNPKMRPPVRSPALPRVQSIRPGQYSGEPHGLSSAFLRGFPVPEMKTAAPRQGDRFENVRGGSSKAPHLTADRAAMRDELL